MKKIMWIPVLVITVMLTVPVTAQTPYLAEDESWITLTGTVVSADTDSFLLDYGEGLITVEMDDWDWYGDAYAILSGDEVTVYGRVDDDLYETTSIEASSVYVDQMNTYFYASSADEEITEGYYTVPVVSSVYVDADLQLVGKVSSVSGREFTLNTGNRKVQVDTSEMLYNPMDDKGFQRIQKGDRVQVSGDLDSDVFEKRELMAESIITLTEDKTKNKPTQQSKSQ